MQLISLNTFSRMRYITQNSYFTPYVLTELAQLLKSLFKAKIVIIK
jgi:hypothetical protein